MTENDKGIPNWLLFVFFGALVVGAGYSVYRYGFAPAQPSINIASPSGIVVAAAAKVPKTAAAIAAGERLSASCAACHGTGLTGGAIGPDLMDGKWLHGVSSETELHRLIMNGISSNLKFGTAVMPEKGTLKNSAEVWQVVYYLSSKNKSIKQDAK